jgi:uncharacterized protein YjbI with pentapeptide repeats
MERTTEPRTPATDYDPDTAPTRGGAWRRLMAWLTTRRLVTVMVGLAAVIFAMGALPDLLGLPEWIPPIQKLVDDLYGNFFVEALSIAATIGVIDLLNQRRLDEQRRRALVDQLYSRVPGFPAEAVRLLKHRGWYRDWDVLHALQNGGDFYLADLRGLKIPEDISELRAQDERLDLSGIRLEKAVLTEARLGGAVLSEAQLAGADLSGAQLAGVDLFEAHLEGADLSGAQLMWADLGRAQLAKASLSGAYLEGSVLSGAYLEKASLFRAQLEGADLSGAQLAGVDLCEVHMDKVSLGWARLKGTKFLTTGQLKAANTLEGCTLPDGTRLPERKKYGDPEPDWRGAFAAWVARGRDEGWIYDTKVFAGYIDVDKIPLRDEQAADS